MILKEIDGKANLNKIQKFGHDAEKQMAFYLKRAFQDKSDLVVINDLRIQMDDDTAQIDHLIIHKFGFRMKQEMRKISEIYHPVNLETGKLKGVEDVLRFTGSMLC